MAAVQQHHIVVLERVERAAQVLALVGLHAVQLEIDRPAVAHVDQQAVQRFRAVRALGRRKRALDSLGAVEVELAAVDRMNTSSAPALAGRRLALLLVDRPQQIAKHLV